MNVPPSILVVDDDAAGRSMLSLSLRQAGFPVRTAAGGAEALGLLKERRYGWLITDAQMIPMDGFRLTRAAKRLQPELRVIMVSAVFDDADARGRLLVEKFFTKPVPFDELLAWVSHEAAPGTAAP